MVGCGNVRESEQGISRLCGGQAVRWCPKQLAVVAAAAAPPVPAEQPRATWLLLFGDEGGRGCVGYSSREE